MVEGVYPVKIHLVLTDDWELRGDGSGNMRSIQFDTMRKLVSLYEKFGLKCSFNVEVMQQLQHIKHGRHYPVLLELAREWEDLVKEHYSKGHDIQLHVHPQWHSAQYENNKWRLSDRWSFLDYSEEHIRRILRECKQYLEDLIRPINPDYRPLAFRSGAWAVAPCDYLLPILAEIGIVFDMSIVSGLYYNLGLVKLDYRNIDESFLPYYPKMQDGRHIASSIQPIVCIPTHSFVFTTNLRMKLLNKIIRKTFPGYWHAYFLSPSWTPIDNSGTSHEYSKQLWEAKYNREVNQNTMVQRLFSSTKEHVLSDLAQLSYRKMKTMLQDIREKAGSSGWSVVPVILENHTKDIGDFGPIEKFCATIAKADDIEVITSCELAKNIKLGLYPIRKANVG